MNYCGYCLNHGFRFYNWKNHEDNCSLRRCVCHNCRKVAAQDEDQLDSCMATTSHPVVDNTPNGDMNCNEDTNGDHFLTESIELNSDPLEEVRSFAKELAESDLSEKDLQTCVLYALLESNDFSLEETKKQLYQSRTAITESLILSDLNVNRELNLKRSRSPQKESKSSSHSLSSLPSHPNTSDEKSTKMLCSSNSRAKKSFPRLGTDRKPIANICQTKDSSVSGKTIRKESVTPKTTISPTIVTLCTEVQSFVPSAGKASNSIVLPTKVSTTSPQKTLVIKPYVKPSINVSTNVVTISREAISQRSAAKKPIQSVRPLSNSSAATKLVTMNTSSIVSCKPIASVSSKNGSVERSPNLSISSSNFYSSQKVVKNSNTSQPNISTSVPNSKPISPQKYKIIQSVGNDMNSTKSPKNSINEYYISNLGPEIKTYSKITLTKVKSNDLSDEPIEPKQTTLCAKVITTEDALVALSAIPNSSSSAQTSTSNESTQKSDCPPVPQSDSDDSIDVVKEELHESSGSKPDKHIIGTSFSHQFKLFINNLKNSALSPTKPTPEEQKSGSKSKEIIEITID